MDRWIRIPVANDLANDTSQFLGVGYGDACENGLVWIQIICFYKDNRALGWISHKRFDSTEDLASISRRCCDQCKRWHHMRIARNKNMEIILGEFVHIIETLEEAPRTQECTINLIRVKKVPLLNCVWSLPLPIRVIELRNLLRLCFVEHLQHQRTKIIGSRSKAKHRWRRPTSGKWRLCFRTNSWLAYDFPRDFLY